MLDPAAVARLTAAPAIVAPPPWKIARSVRSASSSGRLLQSLDELVDDADVLQHLGRTVANEGVVALQRLHDGRRGVAAELLERFLGGRADPPFRVSEQRDDLRREVDLTEPPERTGRVDTHEPDGIGKGGHRCRCSEPALVAGQALQHRGAHLRIVVDDQRGELELDLGLRIAGEQRRAPLADRRVGALEQGPQQLAERDRVGVELGGDPRARVASLAQRLHEHGRALEIRARAENRDGTADDVDVAIAQRPRQRRLGDLRVAQREDPQRGQPPPLVGVAAVRPGLVDDPSTPFREQPPSGGLGDRQRCRRVRGDPGHRAPRQPRQRLVGRNSACESAVEDPARGVEGEAGEVEEGAGDDDVRRDAHPEEDERAEGDRVRGKPGTHESLPISTSGANLKPPLRPAAGPAATGGRGAERPNRPLSRPVSARFGEPGDSPSVISASAARPRSAPPRRFVGRAAASSLIPAARAAFFASFRSRFSRAASSRARFAIVSGLLEGIRRPFLAVA